MYSKIILKPKRESSVLSFHPWIFSGAIDKIEGEVKAGDFLEVYDSKKNFLASGHYGDSSIAIRILSHQQKNEDKIIEESVFKAINLRKALGLFNNEQTNAFRLINAEGDNLSGLVVDKYNKSLSLQFHNEGTKRLKEVIINFLRKNIPDAECIIDKSPDQNPEIIFGSSKLETIKENGFNFEIDFSNSQKTGFFLDQRENRQKLTNYCKNKNVLNTFCYTGGFSIYALGSEARSVTSVDSSESAMKNLSKNIALNGTRTNHESFEADCFEFLKTTNSYDLIILDPPAFVKHRGAINAGLKGYESLNYYGLNKILPAGIIFTFSCSQFVSIDDFKTTIFNAAHRSKRQVKILEELGSAPCHPVSIFHPEGQYLKGLVLYVE